MISYRSPDLDKQSIIVIDDHGNETDFVDTTQGHRNQINETGDDILSTTGVIEKNTEQSPNRESNNNRMDIRSAVDDDNEKEFVETTQRDTNQMNKNINCNSDNTGDNILAATGVIEQQNTEHSIIIVENINKIDLKPLKDYVSKQMLKYELMNKKGFESYCFTLFEVRKLILIVVTHFLDISSDIAVAWGWYILYKKQQAGTAPDVVKNVDMGTLYWCCIGILIYYRIASSYKVYMFTQSKKDAFWQFWLDFYLIKMIYINMVKMHSYKPLGLIRIFRGAEGSHESAYQAILSLVFLIQTDFHSVLSIIPLISLIISLWSLAARFVYLDHDFLQEKALSIGISWHSIKKNGIFYAIRHEFNFWYVFHIIFRTVEVIFGLLLLASFWVFIGKVVFGVTMFFLALWIVLFHGVLTDDVTIKTDFLKVLLTVSLWTLDNLSFDYSYMGMQAWNDGIFKVCSACFAYWIFVFRFIIIYVIGNGLFITHTVNMKFMPLFVVLVVVFVILIVMSKIATKKYFKRKDIVVYTRFERLDIVAQIESENQDNLTFCHQLNVNIFRDKQSAEKIWQSIVCDDSLNMYHFYNRSTVQLYPWTY